MDSIGRVGKALRCEVPDRIPVFPYIGDFAGRAEGLSLEVMYRDPERTAEAHIATLRRYGYDATTIQTYTTLPLAEACGCEVRYQPEKLAWVARHVELNTPFDRLDAPDFNKTTSTETILKGTELLAERVWDRVPVMAFVPGPLTLANELVSLQKFVVTSLKNSAKIHELLRYCTQVIRSFSSHLVERGASILVVCEHDAQLFPPKNFHDLSLSYLPPIFAQPNIHGGILHACGNALRHIEGYADELREVEGLDMISVGSEVDLSKVKGLFREEIGVMGNLDQITLLPTGTPQAVEEASKTAIEKGKPGGGYILAPACELPLGTPPENLQALVRSAERYGAYP